MTSRTQDVTGLDFFCGAGGTTTGAIRAGVKMLGAANHWALAIETHNSNHPNVDHFIGDISDTDMARFPKVDILFASPECKTHSPAYGKKRARRAPGLFDDSPPSTDAEERSRATMWDVCRYVERHAPAMVIVENVVEIVRWKYEGELYAEWLKRMQAADYLHREVFINSMIAWPTPQSRDRIYVVFWKRGHPAPNLDITPWCFCPRCEKPVQAVQSWKNPMKPRGKYRQQYVYRCPVDAEVAYPYAYAAATAINWSLPAPRIGDRAKPLADATMARIRAGLERYGPEILIAARGNTFERRPGVRSWPVDGPTPTHMASEQYALVVDTLFKGDGHVRPASDPLATQSGRQSLAFVVPMGSEKGAAFPATHPLRTAVAECSTQALLVPAGGTWNKDARSIGDPMRAQTSRENTGLLVPMRQHTKPSDATEPMPTMLASQIGAALVVPLRTNHPTAFPATDRPLLTMVAGNAGHALLVRQYKGGAEMSKPVSSPAGTITAVDHHALLIPYFGTGRAHPTGEPMGTVDTRDRRALLITEQDIDDCGFRMLEPEEIKRAMAFPDDYKVVGNRRDQVRQWGNALTPPVADVLTSRAVETFA